VAARLLVNARAYDDACDIQTRSILASPSSQVLDDLATHTLALLTVTHRSGTFSFRNLKQSTELCDPPQKRQGFRTSAAACTLTLFVGGFDFEGSRQFVASSLGGGRHSHSIITKSAKVSILACSSLCFFAAQRRYMEGRLDNFACSSDSRKLLFRSCAKFNALSCATYVFNETANFRRFGSRRTTNEVPRPCAHTASRASR
jgi:hypothetical protein